MTIKRGMALFSLFLSIKREITPLHHKNNQKPSLTNERQPALLRAQGWCTFVFGLSCSGTFRMLIQNPHYRCFRAFSPRTWAHPQHNLDEKAINSTKIKLNMKGQSGHSHSTCFCIEKLRCGQWEKYKFFFFFYLSAKSLEHYPWT